MSLLLEDKFSDEAFEAFVKSELGDIAVKDNGRYISPKICNYKRVWDHYKGLYGVDKVVLKANRVGLTSSTEVVTKYLSNKDPDGPVLEER